MTIRRTMKTGLPTLLVLTLTVGAATAVGCNSDNNSAGGYGGDAGFPASGYGGKKSGSAGGSAKAGANSGGEAGSVDSGGAPAAGENAGGAAGSASLPGFPVKQTNLDSDVTGMAAQTDPHLVNAWAIAINPTAQVFWISSNHGGSTPVYGADGSIKPVDPTVAPVTGTDPGSPTGQVFNSGANFKADKFIVDTEDGQILGWAAGAAFTQRAKSDTAIYKGLALVGTGASQQLLAANFHDGTVDVFDVNYAVVAEPTAFKDPSVPVGYAPFNVVPIGDQVFVAYAKQSADKVDDEHGTGHGYVSVFDAAGKLVKSWLSGGELDSPWAISPAPAGFGVPSGALLVGNFGSGTIGAYDTASGEFLGWLSDDAGATLLIPGLWDLKVGPTGTTDLSGSLFFTAGPAGETHGLFGKLDGAPAK